METKNFLIKIYKYNMSTIFFSSFGGLLDTISRLRGKHPLDNHQSR